VTTLTTERLSLEPVTPRNADVLWKVMQSPNLREYQDIPRFTRNEFEQRVASRPKEFRNRVLGRFEWIVITRDERKALGWVSLRIGEHMRNSAELGYSLIGAHRSRGYATEATAAIVGAGFDSGGLARIDACCVPQNIASRRLLDRLGFRQTKTQKAGAVVRGRAVDIIVYEMTRELWAARQAGSENSIVMPASSKPK
jgi:ribosomal-protein-alanine N-acetyltransferase